MHVGTLEMNFGKLEVCSGKDEMRVGKLEVRVGKFEVQAGKVEMKAGKLEVNVGKVEMKTGKVEINAGKGEINDDCAQMRRGAASEFSPAFQGRGGRPLKSRTSRQRRLNSSNVADATRHRFVHLYPALKGRAKLTRRSAAD
jgi:hypothetical protein